MACDGCLQPGHVDTERRRGVVDDFAESFGIDGCPDPNGSESAHVPPFTSGRGARGRNRPAQAAPFYTNLDAGGRDGSCRDDVAGADESDQPFVAHFFSWPWSRAERSSMGSDCTGTRAEA